MIIVVGYAFSPIDLIPDFIPILGHIDDLILVPAGIALAMRLVPDSILLECRKNAHEMMNQKKPVNWIAGGMTISIWILIAILLFYIIL